VRFLDVSDGNMAEGSLRCDVNVSVRVRGATALGTKARCARGRSRAARGCAALTHPCARLR
jgi:hypothetical protein